jgi:hypothetical protein
MAALADSDDLIVFYDEQTIKDLLSDDETAVTDLSANAKLSALLLAASGQVEAACGVSDLYTPTQLAAFTGNAQSLLKQIVCTLCMVMIARRRPEKFGSEYWQAVRKEAEEYLDRLRKGERLFDSEARREAGLPTIDGPTSVDYDNLRLIPSRVRNYFPAVGHRLPVGRSY